MSEECFIARDMCGSIYMFDAKPKEECGAFMPSVGSDSNELPSDQFKGVRPGTCYKLKLTYTLVNVIDNE